MFWIYVMLGAIMIQLGVVIDLVRKIPAVKEYLNLSKQTKRLKKSSDKLKDAVNKNS